MSFDTFASKHTGALFSCWGDPKPPPTSFVAKKKGTDYSVLLFSFFHFWRFASSRASQVGSFADPWLWLSLISSRFYVCVQKNRVIDCNIVFICQLVFILEIIQQIGILQKIEFTNHFLNDSNFCIDLAFCHFDKITNIKPIQGLNVFFVILSLLRIIFMR